MKAKKMISGVKPSEVEIYKEHINKCKSIIKDCGIEVDSTENMQIGFINSLRTYGAYNSSQHAIKLSKQYFDYCVKNNETHDLENTIIHELLHCVAEKKDKGCGHRRTWKYLAEKISYKTPYKITRCVEQGNKFYDESHNMDNPNNPNKAEYIIVCGNCGKTYAYHKWGKTVQNIAKGNVANYRCKCGSKDLKLK